MIEPDKRSAILAMHEAGVSLKVICPLLKVSRNTVRKIIRRQASETRKTRKDKIHVEPELLERLYRECEGWKQRMHEKLVEEEGIQISYSTLTRLIRELGLSKSHKQRCDRVPDEPGAEMQHDTTVYRVKMSGRATKVIASLIYLRYSKRRYLRFYHVFNRFTMKCFFHEALTFWDYSARECIIDNTNLARLRGSGKTAVIVPEMASFGERYGFEFVCHALKHANRKAGGERSFWTVETNFLKGRTFESLEDLNRQALEWATVRMEHRRVPKTGLIPAKAFEYECGYLKRLSPHLPPPYQAHQRDTDQYGYAAFQGNYYWVPGTKCEKVKVLEYSNQVKIYQGHACVAQYPLPPNGVRNARFSPEGQPVPRHLPKHRKRPSGEEEQRLRAMGPEVAAYVTWAVQTPGIQRHRFLRELFALSRRVPLAVFAQALQRALRYRVIQMESLRRIAWLCLSQGEPREADVVDVDESYRDRPAYQEGFLTDEPDLSAYDLTEEESTDEPGSEEDETDEPDSEEDDGR